MKSHNYDYLPQNKLVAVVEIADATQAIPLCRALYAGGVNAIEITLRTAQALAAVKAAAVYTKAENLKLKIGAGTLLSVDDMNAALDAGADFLVSPAAPLALLHAFAENLALRNVPLSMLIPGVATPSEAMQAYGMGFHVVKFFPAEASGGVPWLKSVAGPLPHIRFMPTGGVREATLRTYTDLPNVVAVGGTWLAPAVDITHGLWAEIEQRTNVAVALLSNTKII